MSGEVKLKIIVLGPVSCGKTSISNFLSDATENIGGENRPTKGVRVVEFFVEGLKVKDDLPTKVEVELWDCSGDLRYDSCWPAIQHQTDGVVFVYSAAQQKKDLEPFYKYFVEDNNRLSEKSCLLLFNHYGGENAHKLPANPLPKVHQTVANIEENGLELRKVFNSYLSGVLVQTAARGQSDADG